MIEPEYDCGPPRFNGRRPRHQPQRIRGVRDFRDNLTMHSLVGDTAGQDDTPPLLRRAERKRTHEFGKNDAGGDGADAVNRGDPTDSIIDHLLIGRRAGDDSIARIETYGGPVALLGGENGRRPRGEVPGDCGVRGGDRQ